MARSISGGTVIVAEQIEANLEGARLDSDLVIAYDPAWTTMGLVAPPPLRYAEEIVGQALRNLSVARDEVVIATKGYSTTGRGPNTGGNSRLHLMEAAKASLKRLQLDHIDLYQVHGFDAATPIEETVRALDALVAQGHVRYVGLSNWAAWQVMKALGTADRLGLARFSGVQAYYSLAGRDLEREIVPMLASESLGLLVWSPLAAGLLSGKVTRAQAAGAGDRRASHDFPPVERERAFDCIEAMEPMAVARGVSVAQIALAWLLHSTRSRPRAPCRPSTRAGCSTS